MELEGVAPLGLSVIRVSSLVRTSAKSTPLSRAWFNPYLVIAKSGQSPAGGNPRDLSSLDADSNFVPNLDLLTLVHSNAILSYTLFFF